MSGKPRGREDITGKKFNKLTGIKPVGEYKYSDIWLLQCDCGNTTTSIISRLKNESKKSCGCNLRAKRPPRPDLALANKERSTTHGQTGSRTYASWNSMKGRCLNKDDKNYSSYGGRGITICDSWKSSFESFLKDMGERPQGMTIDRINNNGNYEPDNCRWANPTTQANNTRVCRYVEYQGKTQTASEWAREMGLEIKTLCWRLRTGWDVEEALTTPSLIKRKWP